MAIVYHHNDGCSSRNWRKNRTCGDDARHDRSASQNRSASTHYAAGSRHRGHDSGRPNPKHHTGRAESSTFCRIIAMHLLDI